jgi:hypothetical protein
MADVLDLSPEALSLLRAGATHKHGFCCLPGQVVKNYRFLHEAERAGLLRFLQGSPWITDTGRRAIGAPSQDELARAEFVAACNLRRRLRPDRRDDPRTDFDYRSYRANKYACTLLVKQPDYRENPSTLRVGKTLRSDPQFLGARNSIIQPESEGRFVLTVMPDFIIRRALLSTHPYPLDETDENFTDAERATWDRLRQICISINSRIRSAGRTSTERFRFGESA